MTILPGKISLWQEHADLIPSVHCLETADYYIFFCLDYIFAIVYIVAAPPMLLLPICRSNGRYAFQRSQGFFLLLFNLTPLTSFSEITPFFFHPFWHWWVLFLSQSLITACSIACINYSLMCTLFWLNSALRMGWGIYPRPSLAVALQLATWLVWQNFPYSFTLSQNPGEKTACRPRIVIMMLTK